MKKFKLTEEENKAIWGPNYKEVREMAKLLASAPDLLEALKEIIKYENKKPINKRDYEIKAIAKQAISKAEEI